MAPEVGHSAVQFDELIIDEAQDVLVNGAFLAVLDTVLAQDAGRCRTSRTFGRCCTSRRLGR